MGHRFQEWLACPECDERDAVSTLAHEADLVLECYDCGLVSEYVLGDDVALQNLDADAIEADRGD